MNINERIEVLKPRINYERSGFVRDVIAFPDDFYRAYELAIRRVCAEVRIIEKNLYIPLSTTENLYGVTINTLTKADWDFHKFLNIALIHYNAETNLIKLGQVDVVNIEQIQNNIFSTSFKLALRRLADSLYVQSSILGIDGAPAGVYDTLTSVSGNVIEIETFSNATVGYNVFNLDRADYNDYNFQTISSLDSPEITLNQAPSHWSVGDKVYITNGVPYLLLATFKGAPKINYFDSNSNIPIQEVYIEYVEDIAIKNLYEMLTSVDPNQAKVYASKLQTGLIRSEQECLKQIKAIYKNDAKDVVIKSYQPYPDSKYGR